MVGRLSVGALSAGIALLALHGAALGAEPSAASPAPAAAAAMATPRGAVVVAVGEGSTEAARPLAHDVYREEALRPAIDDATARALIGEPLAAQAPPKVVEIAEIRASLGRSGSDAAARRLLASIGQGARARIVVAVAIEGGRPVAKVLRVETATFESIELGATVETPAAGQDQAQAQPQSATPTATPTPTPAPAQKIVRWPGAVATLLPLASAPKSAAAPADKPAASTTKAPVGPVRPKDAKQTAPPSKPAPSDEKDSPAWKSPWFWAALGGVAAASLAAFGIAKAVESDDSLVRLQGRVAP